MKQPDTRALRKSVTIYITTAMFILILIAITIGVMIQEYRANKPEEFGDNLSGYEAGKYSTTYRVVRPIFDQDDTYVGAIKKTIKEIRDMSLFRGYFLAAVILSVGLILLALIWIVYRRIGFYQNEINVIYHEQIEKIEDSHQLLLRSQNYLESIFDATTNMMITYDGGKFKRGNAAMLNFFDCESVEKFVEKHDGACDFFLEEEGLLHRYMHGVVWQEYILSNKNELHKVCMMKNGRRYSFLVTAHALGFEYKNCSLVVFSDITELEEAHALLREKDEIMIAQSRHAAMGEMISMIAHQWRQPVSVISIGVTNILVDIEFDTLDEASLKSSAQEILEQTQELSKTIDDFRNFFQPQKMVQEVLTEDVLRDSFSVMGTSLKNSDIEVITHFHSANKIHTYSRELMQVLINILKNAKEALLENKVVHKKIFISLGESEDFVLIEIYDNAGGINKDILDEIFHPYFTTKGPSSGTGLGLYMCKTIIEKHLNGTLRAYNKDNGACFEIKLPYKIK